MAISEREQRGLAIAALCKIDKDPKEGVWLVPSQSGGGKYKVINDPENERCTCPDFETRGKTCKHIFAVRYTIERELHADGSETLTETMTVVKKTTYKQQWPAYNAAQQAEKRRLQVLLADLCRTLPEPDRKGIRGQRPHLVKDSIFAMAFKVYCRLSSRRFGTDLLEAHERGHISNPIPGTKVTVFFENPAFTPILKELVAKSAAPLATVETEFAVDSSGFGTCKFERWFDHKYGVTRTRSIWVKAHIACGVKTNCITAVRIIEKDTADCPQLKPLMETTRQSFTVNEVSADTAYASNENFQTVADMGGTAYMTFKSNTTGAKGGLFEKMFHFFQFQRDEYLAHYHKRSNERVFGGQAQVWRCRDEHERCRHGQRSAVQISLPESLLFDSGARRAWYRAGLLEE